ncbi:tetratricopeptide tpr-1 repeat-containing protein [Leptolyngbya sp. Heron Island J]|uniref:tetratricopeptide tpr-1 repeat-containing protein n=1 Tax=Leptolyngbya sp. Heron Island J TaxID=1385935 RepID=UPI0003B97631|nr:tetratricopeptide tpr-1 repeat-containing protein [Leptolyngbya sp. Heron Island J]ESA35449.1 tetratricopeptide tpr-1 repeat-containing protein [Leptolyngbya sp. Heron Island J]
MEISNNGWVVIAVMIGILGIGGGAIAVSILRPLGQNIPFTTPITDLSTPIGGAARHQFNQGIWAYREKAYSRAIECFTKVIDHEPTLAEAFHNRARAQANLAKKQDAAADFVAASDIYTRQGSRSGIDWVKTDLDVLAKL